MTLLELVVVIAIIAILGALLFPGLQAIRRHSDRVVCMSRLQNLWGFFSNYLNDGNCWPQVPAGTAIGTIEEQQWWRDMSKERMNLGTQAWQCPTIARSLKTTTNEIPLCVISYLPTLFDNKPETPLKWPNMPWFTEVGNIHGDGNLLIRTDGAVIASDALGR